MKLVLLFALPICMGNVLQQLYSTVDTLVIGNFCGSVSLAAVGTSSQPVEMLLCIFLGPLVLKLMQVPADTWDYAVSYIRIIFFGTLGNMGYNMNAGILRGLGDSRSSLLFLIISCLVNIILDLLFVAVLGMDVSGAALATTFAMFSSWLFSILYIKRKYPELEFSMIPQYLNRNILLTIIKIGLPLGLNNSIYSVGHILMQSLINAQGSAFMAACSAATKVTGIANVAISSLSSAATTFSGQNLGASNYMRLKKGALQIPFFSGLITCSAGLIVTLFCRPLLAFFTDDPQVLNMAVQYIHIVLPLTWPYAVFNGIICFINGIREVRFPTVVNILMLWAVRIPCGYLIAHFIDGQYVMACLPISFIFGMLLMFTYFFTKRWRKILKLAQKSNL